MPKRQNLINGEGGGRWPHNQQHADEARDNGGGAPQSHFFLEENHRNQNHRQGNALQNGGEIGDRHVHERGEEHEGSGHIKQGARQNLWREQG